MSNRGPALTRINFLYQAAHTTLREAPSNTVLIQHYVKTLRYIAQKNVVKLEPQMKRSICKDCSMLLVPGVTAAVRTKAHREKHVLVTCITCNAVKRFPARDGHCLWTDHSDGTVTEVSAHR